tara:strand:- start:3440 stop:4192 length:753 start_codon:yes stop_codon:yes gene_type:complete
MKRESLHDWREVIDLSPYEKKIKSAANKREKQKLRYKTSRQWSKEATNLTGLKGEYAFHLCTGLPIDLGLSKHGDVGADFFFERISYDIKSTTHSGDDPALLEMSDKRLTASVYVLVRINGWEAKIIGWASRKQIRAANRVDFGYGERLCVKQSEMSKRSQDTIPPYVPSVSTEARTASQRSALQLSKTSVILTLPESPRPKEEPTRNACFPHGPFERRRSRASQFDALYCSSCGRFYGYSREPQLIEDE